MLDWYVVIRAARYLRVPPWELLRQPIFWQNKALESEAIDAEVEDARADQARAATDASH